MKKLLQRAIRFYQKHARHAPSCRYVPRCSEYALEAIQMHGACKGSLLSIWRILRCNPFSKGGYDPVPPKNRPKHPHRRKHR